MSGYARAHRGRWDHPLFKNKQEAAVWAWMTDTARFKAHAFQTKFGMVHLDRAQLLISERGIADDFGLHKNAVRRLLATMVDAQMIALDRDHKASRAGTIATIINYERYQSDSSAGEFARDQSGTKHKTVTGPRRDQGGTTREEREKGEEGGEERPSVSPPGLGNGERSLVLEPSSSVPAVDHVGAAFAAFERMRHSIDPASRSATLSPERRKKLAARLSDVGGLEGWAEVLAIIHASPFLRGETSRTGRMVATIDWLLSPSNLLKVREGNYDERTREGRRSPAAASTPIDAMRAARAAVGLG